jgi:hypothetical protein
MGNYKIIGKDGEANGLLSRLRSNPKFYAKLMDAFDVLGYFDSVITAEVFERDKRRGRVDILLTDKNEDLFIVTPKSNCKEDLNIIRKLSGDYDESYDLSLTKKREINNDNIDLCRVDKTYYTRHGRLMSDRKTFANLFIGGNVAYQLLTSFDKPIDIDPIVKEINSKEEKPTFKDFIDAFGKNLSNEEVDNILEANAYNDFERTTTIRFDDLKEKGKSLTKKI